MLIRVIIISLLQLIFILAFAYEQDINFKEIAFPISLIFLILSIMYTFVFNGFDIKKGGYRLFGLVIIKDEPVTNRGKYRITLMNTFFLASLCTLFLVLIYYLIIKLLV